MVRPALIASAAVIALCFSAPGSAGSERPSTEGADGHAQALNRCLGPCPLGLFISGPGTGRVTSDPPSVDCRADCIAEFDLPMMMATLTAFPDAGSNLVAWHGCTRITDDGRCFIEGLSGMTVCAEFGLVGLEPIRWPCPPPREQPPPFPGGPVPDEPTDHPPLGTACGIRGSAGPNVIRGTSGRDVICGGGGNDRIFGGSGHDLILGGRGDDRIYGGPGREHLLGGPGNDVLDGGPASDELFGDTGADTLFARDSVADLVFGARGADRARVDKADVVRGVERRL